MTLFRGDVSKVEAMPLPEYMAWQRYDAVEPLSVSAALDQLFARLIWVTARCHGDRSSDLDTWMTFDRPSEKVLLKRTIDRFKWKVKQMKQAKPKGVK